jgi:hypothetical protein
MFNKFSVCNLKLHHLAWSVVTALGLAGCGADTSSMAAQSAATNATVANAQAAPVISGIPETLIHAGGTYRYVPSASDPGARVLSYDIVNKPDWATFGETNGELSGTPTASDVGTSAEIEIGVSDGTLRGTVGPFRIRVVAPEVRGDGAAVATISGAPAPVVTAGQRYSFAPEVADPSGATLSFAIVNRPAWATFNTATGQLSGSPTTANVGTSTNILISVSAAGAALSIPAFSITVQAAANNAPTISGAPRATVGAGAEYSFTPTAGDPDGNALTFSILNAPSWTSFSSSSGRLTGTAPANSAGSVYSNIVITATDGNLSASLPTFSIQVQSNAVSAPPVTTGKSIKFNPGQYIELDPGSGGGGLTGWLTTIASLKGASGVKGVMLIQSWADLEFAENVYTQGSGANAEGFAMIDQLLSACKAAGLQFMLGVEDRSFGAAHTLSSPSSFGRLPPYFDTLNTATGAPGYIDAPSGTTWSGSLQMVAKLWDPAVMNRYIALTRAYGGRYDANPNFEMWSTSETAIGAPVGEGGFSYDAYVAQLRAWMPAARAAFPTTALRISGNFLDNVGQFASLFSTALPNAIGVGGPDVKLDLPGNPVFPGTSNLIFNGYEGGTDYRGALPWIAEVQTPDESGSASPLELYNEMMTGSLESGGSMSPNYFVWSFDAGYVGPNAFTNAQILSFVASVHGAVNTKTPSSYQ